MSLRKKIIIAFIICILVFVIPLVYTIQTHVKMNNMKDFKHQTLQLLDSKSNEIGLWLNQRISEIRIMQEDPAVKSLNYDEVIPYLDNINSNLEKFEKFPNETFAIGGLDGKGWIKKDFFIDVSEREYFQQIVNTKDDYVISKPVISRSDSIPIFLISSPIYNNNEKIGFINGAVSLNRVSNIAYDIDIFNGFSWIMNKDSDIYSIDKKILHRNFVTDEDLDNILLSFDNDKLGSIELIDVKDNASHVFYSSIPNADDWILCTIIKDSEINSQINYITDLVLKLGLLFFLIATLFAVIISGSIVKPIQELKLNMQNVSSGNLNSYYISDSKDEVSILGRYYNEMLDNLKLSIKKIQNIEKQKRNAELKSLQSQINPHFLYNTLDTIQWKALENNNIEIASLVSSLSGLFRISLSSGKEFITLEEEINHAKYYLDIQKVRYGEKINYKFNVDDEINQFLIPKLVIQPLIENSIYHGIKELDTNGFININIYKEDECIFISVLDNGVGISKDKLEEIKNNLKFSKESEHYGLYNVNERLKLTFKDKYSINISSERNKGTKITLKIPYISEGYEWIEL